MRRRDLLKAAVAAGATLFIPGCSRNDTPRVGASPLVQSPLQDYLAEIKTTLAQLEETIYAHDITDPLTDQDLKDISHRILVDARPEQRDRDIGTLLRYLRDPDDTLNYPHFPPLPPKERTHVLVKSKIEGHHAQLTLRLAVALGLDTRLHLGKERNYHINDIIKGEFAKAGVYHDILQEANDYLAGYFFPLLEKTIAEQRITQTDYQQNPHPTLKLMDRALDTKFTHLDISWFIELAARWQTHNQFSFETPLVLGRNPKHELSLHDLVMSQISLYEQRDGWRNQGSPEDRESWEYEARAYVPLIENGVHMIDMLGTVIRLFEKDHTARHLDTYKKALTKMYEYHFTTFQDLKLHGSSQRWIDAHMLQYIFDTESWKPAGYELDTLNVVNPKTQADKNVASLIERMHTYGRSLKPGEDFGPSTHLYAGFRNLQRYLEVKK